MQAESTLGRLVVLNGASSAGKTVTAEALLPLLTTGAAHAGLDDILARQQPFAAPPWPLVGPLVRRVRVVVFQLRDGRLHLFRELHPEVVALVEAGRDVIVDTALMDARALLDAGQRFASVGGLLVRHYALVHAHGCYDLVLDPSQRSPRQCAEVILQRLHDGPPPVAFQQLARRVSNHGV